MYFVQQVLLPSSGSSLDSQLSLSLSGYEHGTGHYYYCNRAALCLCLTSSLSPCAHPRHLQILRSVDGITQPDRSVRQHLASCLALARRAAATCSSRMPVCRNIEPIPRCSGTNMYSLAPICYASQIVQGRLHAARSTTCLSRVFLPPSLSPSSSGSLSRPPGMRSQENRPAKTRCEEFGGLRKRQVRSLLDATQTHEAIGRPVRLIICHGRLMHPVPNPTAFVQ